MKNIALGFVFILVWVTMVCFVLGIPNKPNADISFRAFFFMCIFAPIWEEWVFRHAPMLIAKKFGPDTVWPIIIMSSAFFGWIHGYGPVSLLIQGVIGLVFCWVYIKNKSSYWSAVLLHSMWNTFCVVY